MMTTYTKVTRNGQITLPSSVRKALTIEEGDMIEIKIIDEKAVLMPKRLIDKSQTYFWTKEWQLNEKKSSADIESGRVKVFDTPEELIEDLG
jgi:AbrB family looped-hinge helix DNA binding protein